MQEPECLLIKGYGTLSTAPDWPEKQVFMEDTAVSTCHLVSLLSECAWVGKGPSLPTLSEEMSL